MKVIIEIPEGWLEEEKLNNIGFITRTCKEEVQNMLIKMTTESVLAHMKPPKIKISQKELKKAILERMVEEKMQ